MEIAIIYSDNRIFVKFTPEKFKELFKNYFTETNNIDKAFEKIVEDLKKETISK